MPETPPKFFWPPGGPGGRVIGAAGGPVFLKSAFLVFLVIFLQTWVGIDVYIQSKVVMNLGYISCWWYGTFTWMWNFIWTIFRWILLVDLVIDYFIEIAGGFRWAILMSKLLTCKCKPHFSTRLWLLTFASIGGEGRTKFFPSGGEM